MLPDGTAPQRPCPAMPPLVPPGLSSRARIERSRAIATIAASWQQGHLEYYSSRPVPPVPAPSVAASGTALKATRANLRLAGVNSVICIVIARPTVCCHGTGPRANLPPMLSIWDDLKWIEATCSVATMRRWVATAMSRAPVGSARTARRSGR